MGRDVKRAKPAEIVENQKLRDPFFDNARFLAVVLVVIGHTVTLFPPNNATHPAVLLLQTFRMPLLIVITGHLARNFTFSDEKVRGLVTGLALPYLIFELIYATSAWLSGTAAFNLQILLPTYLMWFLMSVIIWRLTVPFWRNVRWPLAVAVALSIISYTHAMPHELTLRRLFSLLPFFVLGVCLQRKHLKFLKKPGMPALGILVLAGGISFYYKGGRYVPEYWTYWDRGYEWLGVRAFPGVFIHLGVLLLATVLAAAVLTLVPSRRTWFTPFGTRTMYAYLLHGLGIMTLIYLGVHETAFVQTIPGVLVSIVVATGAAVLLCTPPVVKVTRWLIEPKANWLFRSAARAADTSPVRPARRPEPDGSHPARRGTACTGERIAEPSETGRRSPVRGAV